MACLVWYARDGREMSSAQENYGALPLRLLPPIMVRLLAAPGAAGSQATGD